MLRRSFILLPGLGLKTEKKLWSQGILTWNDFLKQDKIKGISTKKKQNYNLLIKQASQALVQENSHFFKKIPSKESWRLYEDFKDQAVFLDIEIGRNNKDLILIGLFDGYETKTFVKGVNLHKELFFKELAKYKLLITFNGGSFDIPIIERHFKTAIDLPHFDLKHACVRLGLTGGLKDVELMLDLKRPSHLYGNPSDLWRTFFASKDQEYLELLIKYNEEDIINLKPLAEFCFIELKEKLIKDRK